MEKFTRHRVNPYSKCDLLLKRPLVRYKAAIGQLKAAIGQLKAAIGALKGARWRTKKRPLMR